jgi:hypothetical protein
MKRIFTEETQRGCAASSQRSAFSGQLFSGWLQAAQMEQNRRGPQRF